MTNATHTVDPVDALNRCMPIAKRVMLGQMLEDLSNNFNSLITAINAANVAGLTINTSLQVVPPSQR